ncbi:uncharacterized protein METZ01_LOCUS156945 [marine metagenome]|uniref:Uncharacterized protein n=1 Tax=marine metagenome TaxID=408172 RepID=A0A382AS16_9ZZZZ
MSQTDPNTQDVYFHPHNKDSEVSQNGSNKLNKTY